MINVNTLSSSLFLSRLGDAFRCGEYIVSSIGVASILVSWTENENQLFLRRFSNTHFPINNLTPQAHLNCGDCVLT